MPAAFCIKCGAELEAGHQYCPRCGAERWAAPEARSPRPPPGAGTQPFEPVAAKPAPSTALRRLPFLFAAGAIFWLIQLVQFAAVVAAPAGRDQLQQALIKSGVTGDLTTLLVVEATIVFLFEIVAVALHAGAYFGLKARRPWGWIAAVIVSAGWSLILLGIPVLILLLRRSTRDAYGIT